jgi:hypothetical protein
VKPGEAQALRSTGSDDYVKHGAEHNASLPALICAAIHGNAETPTRLAESALRQLSNDLTMLSEVFEDGTDLVPDIIQRHIISLAHRASAAAELSSRINEANKAQGGVTNG